jgi:hypothetical protein
LRRLGTTLGWTLATALCLGICGVVPRPAHAQASAVAEGRLNAVNAATGGLTIAATALTTNSATAVRLNGNPVSLADLAVGETARAAYDPATGVASEVAVSRPEGRLWGRVVAFSAPTPGANATLTFQRRDGASEVLVVGPASIIPLEDGSDDISSLVGTGARVVYDPVTKVIFSLEPYVPEPTEPDSEPYPAPAPAPETTPGPEPTTSPAPVRYRADGVVVAVDAAGGTFTLLARCLRSPGAKTVGEVSAGRPRTLVLTVASSAELLLEGRPCGLDRLAAGDRARCLYEAVGESNRALKVAAFLPPVRVAAGLVRAVGAGTVAIGPVARPLVLALTGETQVSVDGVPATAAALAVGQRGCALYRERGGAVTALAVVTMSPPVKPAPKQAARR